MKNTKTQKVDGEIMVDGTQAWLTQSGRYYCRAEPNYEDRERIVYYNRNKEHVPLAKATCPKCKDVLESKWCGNFQKCSCGESFVDTDRWEPERHRFGGLAA